MVAEALCQSLGKSFNWGVGFFSWIPILPLFYFMMSQDGVDFSSIGISVTIPAKCVMCPLLSPQPRPIRVIKYVLDDEANVEEEL